MTDLAYALKGYQVSHTAMIIYGVLDSLSRATISKQKGYVFISRKSIAAKVGKCERTARKCVKELQSAGLIHIKRMGRGLNDRIWILPPARPQEETKEKMANADLSVYRTEKAKIAALNIKPQRVNNNQIELSFNPAVAARKRQQDNRPQKIDIERQSALREHYSDILKKQLRFDEYRKGFFTMYEDELALSKMINLMANFMSGNTKIAVNGTVITKQQWWDVAKHITQNGIIEIINKIPQFQDVRKPHAYLLACIYNSALTEILTKPWYIPESKRNSLFSLSSDH